MRNHEYSKKQMIVIVMLSIAMLALAVLLNHFFPVNSREASTEPKPTISPVPTATPVPAPTPVPDPTETVAAFLQGPKSWKKGLEWAGEWGDEYYDGGKFGAFGCGLCCMANIYTTFSGGKCSPIDMYGYAKKVSGYGGGGAIDWGYMKETLQRTGFSSDVWRKPSNYREFQQQIQNCIACIVVVSSYDSDCYWKNTAGHYVTIFHYDVKTDRIFLTDSGNPSHNRQWVALKKIYKSLKTSNRWQYLAVTSFDAAGDQWKHKRFGGKCILPKRWQ